MSNVSSFSVHFLKTIAWLIVFLVHLQRCFVRTSMPLALGDRAVVEKAERKCQGSFSKAIICVYIFVWLRGTKPLVERQSTENITSRDVTVTKTLVYYFVELGTRRLLRDDPLGQSSYEVGLVEEAYQKVVW